MNTSTHVRKFMLLLMSVFIFTVAHTQHLQTYKNGKLQGAFKIKLKPSLVVEPSGLKSKTVSGYSEVGIKAVDQLNMQYEAVKIERLIPYSSKHDIKHQKHGLHLWYKVEIETEAQLESVIKAYGILAEIEKAEPFYEKSLVPHNLRMAPKSMLNAVATVSESPFDDPQFNEQWHYHNTTDNPGTPGSDINLLRAWNRQTGDPDIVVAVIDQGVDYKHEDLAANMWVNEAELNGTPGQDSDGNGYVDDIYGFDFVNMNGDVQPLPHGTHVAGTVAAVNNNGIGVAGVAGGSGNNDGVRIMSCMIMSENSAGSAEAAFVYAADNGAVIAQNSWGWNTPGVVEQSILDAIDYFIEEAGQFENSPMKGGVVIFAAGNNGDEGEYWPGCYEKVIAVAATGPNNRVTSYSNYGDWLDISAPGGDVMDGQDHGVLSTMPDNNYGFYDGTSMACPHVSGIAALIASEYKGPEFDASQLTTRLLGGVNVIDTMEVNKPWAGKVGLGAVDAYLALLEDNGLAPGAITDLTHDGVSGTFTLLKWTVPADEDDDQPRYFHVYYSETPIVSDNLQDIEYVRINSVADAGDEFAYQLEKLKKHTTYYLGVTGVDRWGNEAELSNVITITTNNGPDITLDKSNINFSIDVKADTLSHQQFTITNTGEGLLNWNIRQNHVENIDIYSQTNERIPYKVNYTGGTTGVEAHNLSQTASIEPYAQKPTLGYMYYYDPDYLLETLIKFGESNDELSNSSATYFKVTNPDGFNLTSVQVGLNFEKLSEEPLYLEVYKGGDINSAKLIHSQTFYVGEENYYIDHIIFNKQMFFNEGDEFYIVFHIPPGHRFPFLAAQAYNMAVTDYSYYSNDQGVTWNKIKDIYYDYTKVWVVIAVNELEALEPYLEISETAGYLNANESKTIDLTVNAAKLINGNYETNLQVFGQGYPDLWEDLTLNFEVNGQDSRMESDDLVDFGNVFIGTGKEQSITIYNKGLGAFDNEFNSLNVEISHPDFKLIGNAPKVIPAERSEELTLYFTPTTEGAINATVKVSDKTGKVHTFSLYGAGTWPAKAVVSPPVSEFTGMALGDAFEGSFQLRNEGDFPLRYYVPKFADGSNMPDFDKNSIHNFGYVAGENIPAPGEEAFVWDDIQFTGKDITDLFRLDGSVMLTEAEMGFRFPYFGEEYDTCYISNWGAVSMANNGWFNAKPAGYKNPAQPSKLISAWGMPFSLDKGGKIYYQSLPGKFIIQYQGVVHESYNYDSSSSNGIGWLEEPITFQIVLHQTGDIDFNYKDLGEVLGTRDLGFNRASTLIMIEDQSLDDRIVLNGYGTKASDPFILNTFPTTGHQIYFKNPGFGVVDEITNAYGTVPVGSSVEIRYKGSTEKLYQADFDERINIVSTDPVNNPVNHTIKLNITSGGQVDFVFEPQMLDFGNVFQRAIKEINLRITNEGRAIGTITDVALENGLFTVDGYLPAMLRPNTVSDYTVTVNATELGIINDVLVVTDDEGQTYRIPVTCNVVDAPVISSGLNEINTSLKHGDSTVVRLDIINSGNNPMQVTPSANEWLFAWPDDGSEVSSNFDYTYTIEHNTDSRYLNWSTAIKDGTKLDVTDEIFNPDKFWMTVPLPFEIAYYGEKYDTIYIGHTGVITVLPDQPSREWGPDHFIPNESLINGYLAPLFGFNGVSNPEFYPETGIYTKEYNDKFVIRFQDLGSNGGGSAVTVEVWLFKSGIIKYMYEVNEPETARILASLIGIENQDGTKGIQVSARTMGIIKNGTVVTFLPTKSYTVPANSSQAFNVHLNARSLYDGTYTDNLRFTNDTPDNPEFSIPVTMEVIGENNVLVDDTLDMGELMMIEHDNTDYTSPYKRYDFDFTVKNEGTRAVQIRNVKLKNGFNYAITMGDDDKFGTGSAADGWVDISRKLINYKLKPNEEETFRLRVYPLAEAEVIDTVMVYCDIEEEAIKVPVSGVFTLPPVINVQTESIELYTDTINYIDSRSIVFDNLAGSANLEYEVGIAFKRGTAPQTAAVPMTAMPMPSENISRLKVEERKEESVAPQLKSTMADFNRVLQYEQATTNESLVGFGESTLNFTAATGFYAPEDGFNLSHVQTWYAWGDMLDSEIKVQIVGGGETLSECQLLYEQTYQYVAESASSNGALITIPLDENVFFFPNEKFFVVFIFDFNITYPLGTITTAESVSNRYYFGDGENMFETVEAGYSTLGWLVRAAEMEAGGLTWCTIESDKLGSLAPGEEGVIDLSFNSTYAEQGINQATIIIKSNDPYKPQVEVPVSLTRNKGPQYADGNELRYSINEADTLNYVLKIHDEEGDNFTITVPEVKTYFAYTLSGNEVEIVFTPDYDGEGLHEFVVEAEDSYGNATQFTLIVSVANVNRAPMEVIEIGERTYAIETEDAYVLNLSDYIQDPDGDEVFFETTYEVSSAVQIMSTNASLAFMPVSPGYVYMNVKATDSQGAVLETGFPVFIEHRTGIDDENYQGLKLYPNPADDVVYLHMNDQLADISHGELISSSGEVVMSFKLAEQVDKHTLNVSRVKTGVYMLKLYTDSNVLVHKLIKR
ncbi:S8 family serine peptidase [Carboxylicivirga sediminis]|uniref:S8 family serine peptidase n=1 Tax=Carboxylicivirga sediminis TaxID=2006564 RepID=A0A941IYB8_9BACT|nr:S8 family serine peptidase [Carboxylicivirga sediminis]MBR8536398.1 S8 family serine peptidase [Carboxylicivirga sediminis]